MGFISIHEVQSGFNHKYLAHPQFMIKPANLGISDFPHGSQTNPKPPWGTWNSPDLQPLFTEKPSHGRLQRHAMHCCCSCHRWKTVASSWQTQRISLVATAGHHVTLMPSLSSPRKLSEPRRLASCEFQAPWNKPNPHATGPLEIYVNNSNTGDTF